MIAQQHRNKVMAQARELTRILSSDIKKPRILIIAAGSSPDLLLVEPLLKEKDCEIILNDGDQDALEFSLERLKSVRDRLQVVHGNVIKSVGKLSQSGSFDLVLAGGLFDYLPERPANFLIQTVCDRLLATKGRFFFTNLGNQNPYRVWMEYMANWQLIERSKSELLDMVTRASDDKVECSISPDLTGLTWLVNVDKP